MGAREHSHPAGYSRRAANAQCTASVSQLSGYPSKARCNSAEYGQAEGEGAKLTTDPRIRELARFNFRLFWGMVVDLDRMPVEIQAKHFALAEEQLQFLKSQGWLKDE